MVTNERQQEIYTRVFTALLRHKHLTLPLSIDRLCADLNIELIPLSRIVQQSHLSEHEVFDMWGNEDGVACRYGTLARIGYNDSKVSGRVRFTQCEEICHHLLGHLDDPRFNLFDQQFDEETYNRYEEEARIGAGLMLCHPQFFYANPQYITPDDVEYLCGVTHPCAETRCRILNKFYSSITSNPLYPVLPQPILLRPLMRVNAC